MLTTTSEEVVKKLKAHFARYGIPGILISDNGPQFSSSYFRTFIRKWDITHKTSSPGYPRSNGKVENNIKTAKNLMKKAYQANADPWLAILDFRNTPTQGMTTSPVQRLMSRRTRKLLTTATSLLKPKVTQELEALRQAKERQKKYLHHDRLKPYVKRKEPLQLPRKRKQNDSEPEICTAIPNKIEH